MLRGNGKPVVNIGKLKVLGATYLHSLITKSASVKFSVCGHSLNSRSSWTGVGARSPCSSYSYSPRARLAVVLKCEIRLIIEAN